MPDLKECNGCQDLGACCYFTLDIPGTPIAIRSRVPCPYLEEESGLCKRYETRLEVPWCNKGGSPNVAWPMFCPHKTPKKVSVDWNELDEHIKQKIWQQFGIDYEELT